MSREETKNYIHNMVKKDSDNYEKGIKVLIKLERDKYKQALLDIKEYIERNRVHFDDITKNRIPNICASAMLDIINKELKDSDEK